MKTKEATRNAGAAGATIIGLCLLIAVAILVSGCNGDEPPPIDPPEHPWTPCECDAPMFQLSGVEEAARYTVVPDRSTSGWMYKMGELVTITYKTPADKRLLYWWVDPPSHLAHHSQDAAIHIYMTANIWVGVLTGNRYVRIKTRIDSNSIFNGILGTPTDQMVEYGTPFTITAIPNDGYRTCWNAIPLQPDGNPYGCEDGWHDGDSIKDEDSTEDEDSIEDGDGDSVKVHAVESYLYSAHFYPTSSDDPPHRGSIVVVGGDADIYTARHFSATTSVPYLKYV